jgi:formylglycine-generating enzyme
VSSARPKDSARLKNMAWVPAGKFLMGSEDFYPEERPARHVEVDGFWMDDHPVTVAEFRRFVKATSYVSWAERAPDPDDYPGADPQLLVPGSLVFERTPGPVDLTDYRNWWVWTPGAQWRHPEGPGSTLHGRELHPVTHVAYEDAVAYATWAGKQLPTEAQWERAARGGLEGKVFCWGDEFAPRYERTSPVKRFPPNGYGLYDMAGNVWEWTSDYFTPRHPDEISHPCCSPQNPRVTSPENSYNLGAPGAEIPRRVTKGGSHLCAPNYCLRYRPAARQGEAVDTTTSHIGFRCIIG